MFLSRVRACRNCLASSEEQWLAGGEGGWGGVDGGWADGWVGGWREVLRAGDREEGVTCADTASPWL